MRRPGRRLSADEAEAWAKVAKTVAPMQAVRPAPKAPAVGSAPEAPEPAAKPREKAKPAPAKLSPPPMAPPPPKAPAIQRDGGLDSSWDRKLTRGVVSPDYTLDLHGASLDAAYSRLLHGLTQARALDARVVLIVTGKPRPVDAADRGTRRGAIRAKIVDWLAASSLASDIATIRNAHRRHGGSGALYVILKRRRS